MVALQDRFNDTLDLDDHKKTALPRRHADSALITAFSDLNDWIFVETLQSFPEQRARSDTRASRY